MKVVLFRHGIAVDRWDPACPPDPVRPLTAVGVERTRLAARGLARLGVAPDRILSSPYTRALQTAGIAAAELGGDLTVETSENLLPSADPERFSSLLGGGELLVTGHEPHLSSLAGWLASGRSDPWIRLKKAGAACVELEEGETRGDLIWLLTPRALRDLGGSS